MPETEVIETTTPTETLVIEPTTPVEASTETPVAEIPPQTPEPTPEDRQTRFQRRIDALTRKNADLQRTLEVERTGRSSVTPASPAPSADVEPQEAEFADYGSYIKALTTHAVKQSQCEVAQAAHSRAQQDADAALADAFEPQLHAARTKYEDFDEVVSAPIFAPETQAMLMQSPHGAEIGYYLGLHPAEAATLNHLTPVAKARAIVALEQQIGTKQTKTVSTAPAPITPVTGSAESVKDPSKMTTPEWMAWDKQQRLERLKTKPLV